MQRAYNHYVGLVHVGNDIVSSKDIVEVVYLRFGSLTIKKNYQNYYSEI